MDRYPDFDAYAAAKHRVFRNQRPSDVAIVNASERRATPRGSVPRTWRFSAAGRVEQGAFLDGDELVVSLDGHERRLPRAGLKLQGLPNVENALAAWLAARAVGVDDMDVQIAFGSFEGLILGGKDKAGEFERMRELVGRKARYVLTIGAAADRIAQALEGAAPIVPLDDMQKAVAWARQHAQAGDTVLLSPACASFDQYRNFEHRGQHFEELVRAL